MLLGVDYSIFVFKVGDYDPLVVAIVFYSKKWKPLSR